MSVGLKSFIASSVLIGGNVAAAAPVAYTVEELKALGFDVNLVSNEFRKKAGISVELSTEMIVSSENEGKDLRFQTLDSLSVDIPFEHAAGPYNKFSPEP